jgi:hypothetical protein
MKDCKHSSRSSRTSPVPCFGKVLSTYVGEGVAIPTQSEVVCTVGDLAQRRPLRLQDIKSSMKHDQATICEISDCNDTQLSVCQSWIGEGIPLSQTDRE